MKNKTETIITIISSTASRLYLTNTIQKGLSAYPAISSSAVKPVHAYSLRKFCSLAEMDRKAINMKTKTIELLIWHNNDDKSNWGHVALRAGTKYLSVWPKYGAGPTRPEGKSLPTEAALQTYEEDTRAEGTINIDGTIRKRHPEEIISLDVTETEFREITLKIEKVKGEIEAKERGYVAIMDIRSVSTLTRLFKSSLPLSKSGNCITSINYVLMGTSYHIEVPLFTLPKTYSKLIREMVEKKKAASVAADTPKLM